MYHVSSNNNLMQISSIHCQYPLSKSLVTICYPSLAIINRDFHTQLGIRYTHSIPCIWIQTITHLKKLRQFGDCYSLTIIPVASRREVVYNLFRSFHQADHHRLHPNYITIYHRTSQYVGRL